MRAAATSRAATPASSSQVAASEAGRVVTPRTQASVAARSEPSASRAASARSRVARTPSRSAEPGGQSRGKRGMVAVGHGLTLGARETQRDRSLTPRSTAAPPGGPSRRARPCRRGRRAETSATGPASDPGFRRVSAPPPPQDGRPPGSHRTIGRPGSAGRLAVREPPARPIRRMPGTLRPGSAATQDPAPQQGVEAGDVHQEPGERRRQTRATQAFQFQGRFVAGRRSCSPRTRRRVAFSSAIGWVSRALCPLCRRTRTASGAAATTRSAIAGGGAQVAVAREHDERPLERAHRGEQVVRLARERGVPPGEGQVRAHRVERMTVEDAAVAELAERDRPHEVELVDARDVGDLGVARRVRGERAPREAGLVDARAGGRDRSRRARTRPA